MPAEERGKGGCSLSQKRTAPFKSPKRKVSTLRDWGLKRCTACGIGSLRGSIASLAAIGAAIRLVSAPIIRCRSADLALVQPNHRLPIVRILRRAPAMPPWQAMASLYKSEVVGNCVRVTNRRQSDSENRSRANRIATPKRGNAARRYFHSGGIKVIQARDCQSKRLSLGVPKGIFSFAKENIPFVPHPCTGAGNLQAYYACNNSQYGI